MCLGDILGREGVEFLQTEKNVFFPPDRQKIQFSFVLDAAHLGGSFSRLQMFYLNLKGVTLLLN